MDIIKEVFAWLMANYEGVFVILAGIVGLAEAIVRITPTKKDDGAVQRLGNGLKIVMDFLKIPNMKRADGKLGIHKKK